MAKGYVPIYFDWVKVTEELTDQEKGRLIDALVLYAQGGDWQERIKGNERYLFPAFREQLNRNDSISKSRATAGAIGGSANASNGKQTEANVSNDEQTETNVSKSKQTQATESKSKQTQANSPKEEEENKEKEKEEKKKKRDTNERESSPPTPFLTDDDAVAIVQDHGEIFDRLRYVGFTLNQKLMDDAVNLYAEHGKDKLLQAIDKCAGASGNKWNYLLGVLKHWDEKKPVDEEPDELSTFNWL